MLTYKKQFFCNNMFVTAIVGEDGSLTLDGFNEEYEDTLIALGAKRSICKKLLDEWEDSRRTAITEYLTEDIRAAISTAADAVEKANLIYAKKFLKKQEDIEILMFYSTISKAVSNARRVVRARTSTPSVGWLVLYPDFKTVSGDMDLLFEAENQLSRGRDLKSKRVVALMNLYLAAGYLCRSIRHINGVEANRISDLEKPAHAEEGWWGYVTQNSGHAMHHSAWSLGFASDKTHGVAYESAMDWIVGRFVLGMNSLEAGHEWPALEPL